MMEHWFWLLMAAACLVWYSTVTVYVAIRGLRDIKEMLSRLSPSHRSRSAEDTPGSGNGRPLKSEGP